MYTMWLRTWAQRTSQKLNDNIYYQTINIKRLQKQIIFASAGHIVDQNQANVQLRHHIFLLRTL
jgi:hypothetical protein